MSALETATAAIYAVMSTKPTTDEENRFRQDARWAVGPVGTIYAWRLSSARLGWELAEYGTMDAIAPAREWRAAYALAEAQLDTAEREA